MEYTTDESPGRRAVDEFRAIFQAEGWQATEPPPGKRVDADLILEDRLGQAFYAEVKASTEGRPDRVTALFAQAVLQSRAAARRHQGRPAVLIWVKSATPSLVQRIQEFRDEYAEGEPFALISGNGLRHIRFLGLETPSSDFSHLARSIHPADVGTQPRLIFSDRAQWMLKLLLAPDVPESLLNAPRARYQSAADLARAAGVSSMTASRLVNALRQEGFLENALHLQLVMRRKLAQRWKAEYLTQPPMVPAKFLMPGSASMQIEKLLQKYQGVFLSESPCNRPTAQMPWRAPAGPGGRSPDRPPDPRSLDPRRTGPAAARATAPRSAAREARASALKDRLPSGVRQAAPDGT